MNRLRQRAASLAVRSLDDYVGDIVSRVSLGNRKIKAVIDAGNGMGGVTAVPVYRELGVEMVELFIEPDSTFPNHHPDPTVEENLTDIIAAVREHKADLGIAFDGDGDRVGVVDETGRIIWGDELMVLFSRAVLADDPGATIIGEVKCSQTLYDDIEKHGGKPLMWKAGHSLIKAKMKETNAALAGEMSGHIFFADRFYGFDDATYAGARVLEILSKTDKPLSALLADLPKTFSTPELRVDCSDETKFDVVAKVVEHFSKTNEVIAIDGARIIFENGWGLVRASNTQAILVFASRLTPMIILQRYAASSNQKLPNSSHRHSSISWNSKKTLSYEGFNYLYEKYYICKTDRIFSAAASCRKRTSHIRC